ncbi:MAG: FecR domain-containing protein [Muribaculaceae bacterium]|nr:FecR domain-containing protein [Muribaculaceae bacterium]
MQNTSNQEEIIDNISSLIDKDIDILVSGHKMDMSGLKVPEFDQYGVYERIMADIETQRTTRLRKIYFRVASIAAAIAIIVGAYFATSIFVVDEAPIYSEIYAPKGEKLVILMTDGSRVWLNADSKLEYPEDFTTASRNVRLTGEAYFEVAKDEERPFTVTADDVNIRVLGTAFNVSAYPTDSEIITTLCTGKISIGDFKKKNYIMAPGETAVYNRQTSEYTIVKDDFYSEAPQWRDNYMAFRNATLANVLENLSRRYDIDFVVKDKIVNTYTYNLMCNVNDLRSILDMISNITPVGFEKVCEGEYAVVSKMKSKN